MRAQTEAARAAIFIVGVFFALTLVLALYLPLTPTYDEIAHFSAITHQRLHPEIFPHYEAQVILAPDLKHWTAEPTYISHPSLYYLLFAPLSGWRHSLLLLRLVNVVMASSAVAITVAAGWRLLATDASRIIFAVLAASFPKAALIGAIVNNDNLAALAAALVFAGVAGVPGASAWLMIGIVLAGWSKMTTFIAIATVAGVIWCRRWWRGEASIWSLQTASLLLTGAIGAIPYVAEFLRTGHFVYFDWGRYWVAPAARAPFGIIGYIGYFLGTMAVKWPAAEGTMPVWLATIWLVGPLALAAIGLGRPGPTRWVGTAYFVGLFVTLAIHIAFGWHTFAAVGDLSSPQTRYYNILWPGIALAGAVAIGMIAQRARWLAWLLTALYLVPTVIGGVATALA